MDFGMIFVHAGDGPNDSGLLLGSSSWCHDPYMLMGCSILSSCEDRDSITSLAPTRLQGMYVSPPKYKHDVILSPSGPESNF
jgi:hypothetical protein